MLAAKNARKRVSTGIDIGSHSIKVLESVVEQDIYKITRFGVKEFSSAASDQVITESLKSIIDETGIQSKDVSISLSGPNALVRFISVPAMKPEELKNSLKFEADKYIPFSLDDVNIDSFILNKTPDSSGQMKVLLAAAKKSLINERIGMLEKLGLNVTHIDLDVCAVINAFLSAEKKNIKDSVFSILDIGHTHTDVIICNGEITNFIREVQLGGNYIQKIVKELTMSQKASDITEPIDETMSLKVKPNTAKPKGGCDEILKEASAKIGEEIKLSFGYFENQFGMAVNKIFLCGSVGNMAGLPDCLEESLGIKPVLWDPIAKFTLDANVNKADIEAAKYSLAVCAGLVSTAGNNK